MENSINQTEKKSDKPKMSIVEVKKMIYKRIKDTYNNEKGKNFISHLIRGFLPISKITLVDLPVGKMECCITNKTIISVAELKEFLKTQPEADVIEYITKKATDWSNGGKGNTNGHAMDKLLKGRYMGVKCNTSEKYLSELAWHELYRFALDEVNNNNVHISLLITDQRNKENKAEVVQSKKKEAKPQFPQKFVNPSPTVQTLDDNPTLRMLSERFNSTTEKKFRSIEENDALIKANPNKISQHNPHTLPKN